MQAAVDHFAAPSFWYHYRRLPGEVQDLADKNFALLRQNRQHPSVRLKKIEAFWSARVGLHYRALARDRVEGLVWFGFGSAITPSTISCSRGKNGTMSKVAVQANTDAS